MTDESQASTSTRWIASGEIKLIEGTHKPSAYVARAYAFQKKNGGALPRWAKKSPQGNWLFDELHILDCARDNLDHIGISEAAHALGVTRRTIQTWADEDIIPVSEHLPGKDRRILRAPFMAALPSLRKRLETPPIVGYRVKHGLPVEQDVISKIDMARARRQTERSQTLQDSKQAPASRVAKKAAGKEAQLAIRLNRKLEAAERKLTDLRKRKSAIENELRQGQELERFERSRGEAIQEEYEARLSQSARAQQSLNAQAVKSERKLERVVKGEAEAMASIAALRKSVSAQIDSYHCQNAQVIATQLREKHKTATKKEQPATDEARQVKQSAEAIAARLNQARDSCARSAAQEKDAIELATGIRDDMPDGKMDRIHAAILFNDLAERRGITSDIRIKITRAFFSRRA